MGAARYLDRVGLMKTKKTGLPISVTGLIRAVLPWRASIDSVTKNLSSRHPRILSQTEGKTGKKGDSNGEKTSIGDEFELVKLM